MHEWFYNGINPYEWQFWLSKGFAMFFGIYAINEVILYLALIISITLK